MLSETPKSYLQKFLSTPEQKKFDQKVRTGEYIIYNLYHRKLTSLVRATPWKLDAELEQLDR